VRRAGIAIPVAVRGALLAHARRDRPKECCGFLLGRGSRVWCALPMKNIEPGNTRYRIDDTAHIALRRILRDTTPPLAIVGVYHSHPAGRAVPSPTDLADAMYPEWTYIIVGLEGRPLVRAFRLKNGRYRTVRIRWHRKDTS
jgi:proteasome lid subunit RPN8/RPN11